MRKRYLAIETSCDETALAFVLFDQETGHGKIEAEILYSQIELHQTYGGVFPYLAKQAHSQKLVPLFWDLCERLTLKKTFELINEPSKAERNKIFRWLKKDQILLESIQGELILQDKQVPKIDGIFVTNGPGLEPALWTGINFARILALLLGVPLYPIHHLLGHYFSAFLNEKLSFSVPVHNNVMILLVSGGHTELLLEKNESFSLIGRTRDDAAGEAYDKTARLLGLPYPGGRYVAEHSSKYLEKNKQSHRRLFPRPMLNSGDFDFSFSGLKTAVKNYLEKYSEPDKDLICHEIDQAIIETLEAKTSKALDRYQPELLVIAGGVTANMRLQHTMSKLCMSKKVKFRLAPRKYATDNAVMIAAAGAILLKQNRLKSADLDIIRAESRVPLETV